GDLKKTMTISLKYGPNKEKVLTGIKRISKPGLRIYVEVERIPRVLNGLGLAILSTSQGLLTDKQARSKHIGGEVVAYVW
ncbi:MAG: 30S ribosomal protein S8, partial [Erysipelotrichaceae bacterium]